MLKSDTNQVLKETIKLQHIASDPKNSSWVFASAGSGKTRILVNRVLRLLLEGVNPSKILCLTYTKIAANEMQSRIYQELSKWIWLEEDKLISELINLGYNSPTTKQLTDAKSLLIKILDQEPQLKIQTIHSFCQDLMKAFPFESKIKPDFDIIDEEQEKLLLIKARKNILGEALTNPDLKAIISSVSSKIGEDSLIKIISDLLAKKEELMILKQKYYTTSNISDEIFKNLKINKSQNQESIFLEFISKITSDFTLLQELVNTLKNSDKKTDISTRQNIGKFLSNPSFENFFLYKETLLTDKNQPRKLIITSNYAEEKFLNLLSLHQKLLLDFLDQLNSLKIAIATTEIIELSDKILNEYLKLKEINSYLDYNDLIIKTNQLLLNSEFEQWVKYKMDGFFDHILIDESQDTNDLGWNIIKAITEDFFSGSNYQDENQKMRTIFIVGDQKQSIFSFQGAKPDICEEIYEFFAKKLSDLGSKLHKINLNSSFRSNPTILETIDRIFLNQEHKLALKASKDFNGHNPIRTGIGRFELWPEIKLKKDAIIQELTDNIIDFSPKKYYLEKEFLAEIIALKIKDWVENNRVIGAKNRSVNYGDVMILLRNRTNGFDKILNKFLNKHSIPYLSNSKLKVTDSIIICDLLAIAKFASFPDDDLNLAALLKSPFFNFSEDELFEICQVKNQLNITLFKAISSNQKYFESVKQLQEFILKSKNYGVYDFFYYLVNYNDNSQKILSRFKTKSIQVTEIINQFLLIALDFEKKFSINLLEFLDYVEKLSPEISLSSHDLNQNLVTITTAHSSKGLQSPIVIIPDTIYNFDQMPASRQKIFWINCGQDKLPFFVTKAEESNDFIKSFQKQKTKELKDEYLRLLYVAASRAEDELYVAGFNSNPKASQDQSCWYYLIKNALQDYCSNEEFLSVNIKNCLSSDEQSKNFEQIFDFNNQMIFCGDDIKNLQDKQKLPTAEVADFNFKLAKIINGETSQNNQSLSLGTKNLNQTTIIKGLIIHKTLEVIGKASSFYYKNQLKIDKKYILNIAKETIHSQAITDDLRVEIINQITNFIESEIFDYLFLNNIECELEISGYEDGNLLTKRIDLLIIKENELIIVDYKSDDINEEDLKKPIPALYQQQLSSYKNLLAKIYSNYNIKTAILWVKFLQLTEN